MLGAAAIAAIFSGLGLAQGAAGLVALERFIDAPTITAPDLPPISVLKPLHGEEPALEAALASFLAQDYPDFQVVFGIQNPADPALAVVERLRRRFPERDIALVVDATQHGRNRKVGNLINMQRAARHDTLVIADADIHVAPDYLRSLAAALAEPGTGMVTTLYTGLPVENTLASRIGAMQISQVFLPGVVLARALGREDGLGATMALRRATLDAAGGFAALADLIADDAALGARVRALGLHVRLARTVPATTVAESGFRALCRHELRWARVNRSIAPLGFAASLVQYPLAFALMALALAPAAGWAASWLVFCWFCRAAIMRGVDRRLGLAPPTPLGPAVLLLRDLLSVAAVVASFTGNKVVWRGEIVKVDHASTLLLTKT